MSSWASCLCLDCITTSFLGRVFQWCWLHRVPCTWEYNRIRAFSWKRSLLLTIVVLKCISCKCSLSHTEVSATPELTNKTEKAVFDKCSVLSNEVSRYFRYFFKKIKLLWIWIDICTLSGIPQGITSSSMKEVMTFFLESFFFAGFVFVGFWGLFSGFSSV